jgi:cytochrome c oxidase subunit 2
MMLLFKRLTVLAVMIVATLGGADTALAGLGQPSPWQLGLQKSASPVMDNIIWFHDFLLYIITGIAAFVLVLLIIVMVRFNARANPTPSRTTHNTLIEIAWTLIPIMILMFIAVPSFKLLFYQLNVPAADLTVKATGKQWFWTYSYTDNGEFEFDSLMLKDGERKEDQPRLLTVDNDMVVPVNKTVRVITTGADVIHAFGAVVRDQDRRHSRPDQRDLVHGRAGGCLLWSVLGTVRQGSRFHADRSSCGERAGVLRLGRRGQEEIRSERRGAADPGRLGAIEVAVMSAQTRAEIRRT